MDKTTHEVRQARWAALIQECNNSGMSKKAWLKEHHVNEKQFYYWQRRIRAAAAREMQDPLLPAVAPSVDFTEISLPPESPVIHVAEASHANRADAVLRAGNMTLEVSNSLSPVLLATLLQVMAHAQ